VRKDQVPERSCFASNDLTEVLIQKLVAEVRDDLLRIVLIVFADEIKNNRESRVPARIDDDGCSVSEPVRSLLYGFHRIDRRIQRKNVSRWIPRNPIHDHNRVKVPKSANRARSANRAKSVNRDRAYLHLPLQEPMAQ